MTLAKKGDWVSDGSSIAVVKNVTPATDSWEATYDLFMYDREGTKVGRVSPVMGGPKGFEPCCSAANYKRIQPPRFPLSRFAFVKDQVVFIDA